MLNLFKPPRSRLKSQAEKMFVIALPVLEGMSSEEIGSLLDTAHRIKMATTLYGSKENQVLLFRDPVMVEPASAFSTLKGWLRYIKESEGDLFTEAKSASLMIWWLSLAAIHIPELRLQGRNLWAQLERGYPHVQAFVPADDYVLGLEPNKE